MLISSSQSVSVAGRTTKSASSHAALSPALDDSPASFKTVDAPVFPGVAPIPDVCWVNMLLAPCFDAGASDEPGTTGISDFASTVASSERRRVAGDPLGQTLSSSIVVKLERGPSSWRYACAKLRHAKNFVLIWLNLEPRYWFSTIPVMLSNFHWVHVSTTV